MRRCVLKAILPASLWTVAQFLKLTPVPSHMLLCFLAVTSPARDVSPFHFTDYTCIQNWSRWRRSPNVSGRSVLFPQGTRVTYGTQRRFCQFTSAIPLIPFSHVDHIRTFSLHCHNIKYLSSKIESWNKWSILTLPWWNYVILPRNGHENQCLGNKKVNTHLPHNL